MSQELFDRVQALLQQRGEDHAKRAGQPSDYLLTGLIVCGRCCKHFVGTAATGNRYRYRYYTCFSKGRYGKSVCDADRLQADELDKALIKSLIETFEQTSVIDDAIRSVHEQQNAMQATTESELSAITSELKSTEDAIERYLLAFERGTLDEETFAERVKNLGARAADLRNRREGLQNLAKIPTAPTPTPQILESIRQNIAKIIESGDPTVQKRLVQALVAEIRVKSRSDITPVFRIPLDDAGRDNTKVRDLGNLVGPTSQHTNLYAQVTGASFSIPKRYTVLRAR